MVDNSLGKSIKEPQKLAVHSAPPPEKLTCDTDFARWKARCKDYFQGFDAKAQSGAILALLDDEIYDLVRSVDISSAASPSVIPDGLREILGKPGESIIDFQQALRLLGRKAFPTLDAKALNNRVLEQLVAGVHDPQIRDALLRDRPSTLEKALALAPEEEVPQAVREEPPRSLFGVTAAQPHSSHDASTKTPWQPCSCVSSPRRNN
ncbi:unnamed protein product [Schistocephalus solidus]|uniref:Uncharacterized protein n=1 Tax=Schistocephalus solidus TaxID=70667 RepID=A0A183S9A9_SCHSO|nr:unnamed protein product [Schistocephalus solidus]